jgi:hypothetical protein
MGGTDRRRKSDREFALQQIAQHIGLCPFIGHMLDTPPADLAKPLKSLARPTGIEPVFPP